MFNMLYKDDWHYQERLKGVLYTLATIINYNEHQGKKRIILKE